MRAGRLSPFAGHRHPPAVAGIAGDRGLDGPRSRTRIAPYERLVNTVHVARANRLDQRAVGPGTASHDEQSRGVLVEPVHQAGAPGTPDRGDLGIVMKQRMDQRAPRDAGAGVDDEPGGFGDHDQVRVLVDHIERPFLGLEPCGRRERNFDLNEVAGLQSQGGARPATVDGGAAFANQPLETATRQVRLRRGQEAIQPLPRSGLRHRPAQYPHAWVASGAR